MTTVAVLGTGIMGVPIARNLAAAGLGVRAWNRTGKRAEPLGGDGATVCADVRSAVTGADVLVTMLTDADAVADVVIEAGPALADGALWLQMSTVGVAGAERLAALAADRGIDQVDAPVLGSKAPAESGELVVIAAGAERLRGRAAEIFEVVGKATSWVGTEPGAASALKMVVNSWVLALTDAVAEAIALAEGLGLDPRLFLDTIAGGGTDSPYAHLKGEAMLAGELPPAFGLANALKDAGLVVEAGERAGVRLAVAAAVRDDFARAAGLGHGEEDMGAVYYAHRSAPAGR
ncbi:MAG: NAD(P)-dependent oxidoreductase [Frankiaceae bacterium]